MIVIVVTTFAVIFAGELPDKTAVASLVLGARYRPLPVLAGVCTAFALHVAVAVTAGGFLAKLPRTPVELVTAGLFLVGAVLLLRSHPEDVPDSQKDEADQLPTLKIATTAFALVLVAEFGDLTQILTATLAARYNDPLAVGIGAVLALWSVAALAVAFGQTLLRVIPLRRVQQLAAVGLLALAVYSLVSALTG